MKKGICYICIDEGETFGLVGESGSGKTTTGRCLLRLIEPSAGEVRFRGDNVLAFSKRRLREARLYLVTDDRLPEPRLLSSLEQALAAGTRVVQYRAKSLERRELLGQAERIQSEAGRGVEVRRHVGAPLIFASSAAEKYGFRLRRNFSYLRSNSPVHWTARSGPVCEIEAACSSAK